MKKLKYSTRRMQAIRTPAKASNYIAHIDDLPTGPVVLYLRVSTLEQALEGHLEHQETKLREVESRGHPVIAVFKETAAGWAENRVKLERAASVAKEAGAILLAETSGRFIRTYLYGETVKGQKQRRRDGKKVHLLPSVFEFERLMSDLEAVTLATFHDPDLPEDKVRGHETKRGQAACGNRGGRPKGPRTKKEIRQLKMPKALKLHEAGQSYRKIGGALGVPWSTVWGWIKRYGGN